MQEQNFKNHGRMVPGFHYLCGLLILALLIGSIVNLIMTSHDNLYSASLILLIAVIIFILSYYVRAFALKAQDRAIKAEENFRHYLLTGKPMSFDLKMRQIIGLRFASDDEFPALAEKAVADKMDEKEIKQSIVSWKADNYRV
ncbi:MAG: hypothetical protein COB73_04585 [Flavobacteriaceae bacterium]|nr:MAG: hypothetical protein COB73_04585 [Flavobacteriaceae bacterium]